MLNWLYPERCPVCLRIVTPKGGMLHPECRKRLDTITEPVCMKCGMPLSDEEKANYELKGAFIMKIAITSDSTCDLSKELVEKYDIPFNYMQKNAQRNASENTELGCDDIFCYEPNKKFDIILSNPPYISASEMSLINREAEHEPETALYGGEDGLDYYRVILSRYKEYLKEGGMLAVEVGFTQAAAVSELFKQAGFKNVGTEKDFSDIQRVVFGTV